MLERSSRINWVSKKRDVGSEPSSLLPASTTDVRFVMSPREPGRDPETLVDATVKDRRFRREEMPAGMVLLIPPPGRMARDVRAVQVNTSLGNVPTSPGPPTVNNRSFVSAAKQGHKDPENWLSAASKEVRSVRTVSEEEMGPVRLFDASPSDLRDVKLNRLGNRVPLKALWPMARDCSALRGPSSGTDPVKLLVDSERSVSLVRSESFVGRVPDKLPLLPSCNVCRFVMIPTSGRGPVKKFLSPK